MKNEFMGCKKDESANESSKLAKMIKLAREMKSTSWFNFLNLFSHSAYWVLVVVGLAYSSVTGVWPTGSLSGALIALVYTLGTLSLVVITQFAINKLVQEDEWSEHVELPRVQECVSLIKARKEGFKTEIKRLIDGQIYLTALMLLGLPFVFTFSVSLSLIWMSLIVVNSMVGFVVWGEYNHAKTSVNKLTSLFDGQGKQYAI